MRRASVVVFLLMSLAGVAPAAFAQASASSTDNWVAAWAASVHGPYPSGNAVAQPDLRFALPSPAGGVVDQTLRLIVKPDRWGARTRLHLSNVFGTQPVTFDDVRVGLQSSAGNLVRGTNQRVTFDGGRTRVTIAAGASIVSDAVALPFVTDAARPLLDGRNLAVSLHADGASGPMTWHAKAMTTSYLTAPHAGSHAGDEDDRAFPFTTTSWFFLDAVDMTAPPGTPLVVCFGDSITDGTASTINGNDRWPDVLSRRLHEAYGDRVSVVNAGIGGNEVLGPKTYTAEHPSSGGPSALDRLDRDVLSLSGVTAVVWLEGVNDLAAGASADAIIDGFREGVRRLHARGVRVMAATIVSSVGSTSAHGTPDANARRQTINTFLRTSPIFDGVADFDKATVDPTTGGLRAEFVPNSSTGGPGDHLHPNRAGYAAMGEAVDLQRLMGGQER
ncbi:MAG TPA: GDSL-type esterase/lipase family protein [Vicinamibacterales bacterium]|nr:GDSL-type esterase/lipase family protein [Vicinamibacterales bacterium]